MDNLESALKRIAELERQVALLQTRLDNQYEWNENLLRRLGKLEREEARQPV